MANMITYSWKNTTGGIKNRQVLFIALAAELGSDCKTWFRGPNREIAERICRELHDSFAISSNKQFSFGAFEQQYNYFKCAFTANITSNLLGQYKEVVADMVTVGLINEADLQAIYANFARVGTVKPVARKQSVAKAAKIIAARVNEQDALGAAGKALVANGIKPSKALVALIRETIIAQLAYFRTTEDAAGLALEMVRK